MTSGYSVILDEILVGDTFRVLKDGWGLNEGDILEITYVGTTGYGNPYFNCLLNGEFCRQDFGELLFRGGLALVR